MTTSTEKAKAEFGGDFKMSYHLAPPLLSKTGPEGRPAKRTFGEGSTWMFKLLARMKRLRGTPLDPFGRTAERRMERALIKQYEADMAAHLASVTEDTRDAVRALAALPLDIRGFGPVKAASEAKAAKRREELLIAIRQGGAGLAKAAE